MEGVVALALDYLKSVRHNLSWMDWAYWWDSHLLETCIWDKCHRTVHDRYRRPRLLAYPIAMPLLRSRKEFWPSSWSSSRLTLQFYDG